MIPTFTTEHKEREFLMTSQQELPQVVYTRLPGPAQPPDRFHLRGADMRLLATFRPEPAASYPREWLSEDMQEAIDRLPDPALAEICVYIADNPMPIVAAEGELIQSETVRLYRVYERKADA